MSHFQINPTRFLIASLALFTAAGCGDSSGPGEPDDPGVLLATGGDGPSDLVWSGDGTEVVYAVPTSLNAVSISTRNERQLVADPLVSIQAFGGAGGRIYFGVVTATNFRVSRLNLTGGGVEIVATNPWRGRDYLLVSADERFLAADEGLYDLQQGTRTDLPIGRPRGFSPDGTQLLYQKSSGAPNEPPFSLISTANGSSQPLHSTSSGSFYFGHRWEGNSPQLLDYTLTNGTTRIHETDGVTGVVRDLVQLEGSPTFLLNANWSPDGRTLGAWIEQGSGPNRKENLYVIHSGSAPAVVASVSSGFFFGPDKPVFSATGNSVAYFYYHENDSRSLYAKTGI